MPNPTPENLTQLPPLLKCQACRKEKTKAEFFHHALCSNSECSRSKINKHTPFYCDFCGNKKEFYSACGECKAPKLKGGIG